MKINCFGVGTDPSKDHVTHSALRATHLTFKLVKRKTKRKKGGKSENLE